MSMQSAKCTLHRAMEAGHRQRADLSSGGSATRAVPDQAVTQGSLPGFASEPRRTQAGSISRFGTSRKSTTTRPRTPPCVIRSTVPSMSSRDAVPTLAATSPSAAKFSASCGVQVGTADTGGGDLDEDLPMTRLGYGDLLDH